MRKMFGNFAQQTLTPANHIGFLPPWHWSNPRQTNYVRNVWGHDDV